MHRPSRQANVFDSIMLALVLITFINAILTCATIHGWKEVKAIRTQLEDRTSAIYEQDSVAKVD